ncbi:H-2 class I histocompatibility antigen, alpha chain-like isoform X20 [Hippocampus zosterae]|uniref:H-2 class I histocompatibility antigen, alpha chain-like isoform X20 n=1 Tax=Hippocampus zosterae TaxID=109293 RepID=UPI00223D5752|nr:H-2 class I histocompatibility antigen, alpha chain-like isoform X20 [Hippocampus zosterae]
MRTGPSVRLLFRVRPCDRQPQLVTPCPSATQLWIPRMYLLVLFVAALQTLNVTPGVHMIQQMIGCEWDDETGEVDGWDQHRYDGEDFISLELKTMRWIAAKPQAFITKNKWEQLDGLKEYTKRYVTEICPAYLKTYVRNGRDFLMRTELPTVFLLQKTPSSPVTCLATGFYPPVWDLFWRKDGEQLYEDVEMGQTLPNHDGTFQTAVHLKVEAAPDAEAKYECVFRLAGVEEAIVVELDDKNILSNARDAEEERVKRVVAIAVTSGVLAVLAAGVAAVLAKRRRNRQGEGRQDLPDTLQRPFPPFPSPLPSETRRPSHDAKNKRSGPAEHVLITPPLKTQKFFFFKRTMSVILLLLSSAQRFLVFVGL